MADKHNIAEGLEALATPVADLVPLEGNPRRGDVAAVARSLERFGQRKPIVVHKDTGQIEAGNHTYAAALSLGWTHIAALFVAEDPTEAKAYAIADNRTGDLGDYDDELLAIMVQDVLAEDAALGEAMSFNEDDLAALLAEVSGPVSSEGKGHGRGLGDPVVQTSIVFDNAEQQERWYTFVRWLRKTHEGETFAERLDAYLVSVLP